MVSQVNIRKEIELYPFQKRVIKELYQAIREKDAKKNLIVAPTGAGKTIMAGKIIHDLLRHRRIQSLIIVHRDILIDQTAHKLDTLFGIECGKIAGRYEENRCAGVQVATIQSLRNRNIDWFHPRVCFWDEAHLTPYDKGSKKLFRNPDLTHIGLTGTPYRAKKSEGLQDFFDYWFLAPTHGELIDQGFLSPNIVYEASPPGLTKAEVQKLKRNNKGEYQDKALRLIFDTPEAINGIVKAWEERCYGLRTVGFPVDLAHAHHICEAFDDRGHKFAVVHGGMPPRRTGLNISTKMGFDQAWCLRTDFDRQTLYTALSRGWIDGIVSVGCLTEGFDVPEVSCVILPRAIGSRAFYGQAVGRGMRIAPWIGKKYNILLDAGFNFERYGIPDSYAKEMYLPDAPDETDGEAPLKECPACQANVTISAKDCPKCGHIFQFKEKQAYSLSDFELAIPEREKPSRDAYQQLILIALHRGYKPGWATMEYKNKFGKFPKKNTWLAGLRGEDGNPIPISRIDAWLKPLMDAGKVDEAYYKSFIRLVHGNKNLNKEVS